MFYVRISLMKALAGREQEVRDLTQELIALSREQPGCISSQFIQAVDDATEMGRLSQWESEAAADTAATGDHSMHLRSRLHVAVHDGHVDRSFRAE